MKVICIDSGTINEDTPVYYIKEGKTYTVVNAKDIYVPQLGRYVSAYKFNEIGGWHQQELFMPLSELDEKDIANNRVKNECNG